MVQYLELVLKRDFASGWKHTVEKVKLFFEKKFEMVQYLDNALDYDRASGWKSGYKD